MGMTKAKIRGEITVMEVSQSSIGVRTRAKTLALQRLQNTTIESSYLQLRSRRLAKSPLLVASNNESKRQQNIHKEICKEKAKSNPNPRTNSRLIVGSVNSGSIGSISLSCSKKEVSKEEGIHESNNDVGIEASFGENILDTEGRDRSTRETTPCSLIKDSDTVQTPGSTTRSVNSIVTNRRIYNALRRNIPTTSEIEEFFVSAEQQQQRLFTEKYNFDPVNDLPLVGRYEWVRVDP